MYLNVSLCDSDEEVAFIQSIGSELSASSVQSAPFPVSAKSPLNYYGSVHWLLLFRLGEAMQGIALTKISTAVGCGSRVSRPFSHI